MLSPLSTRVILVVVVVVVCRRMSARQVFPWTTLGTLASASPPSSSRKLDPNAVLSILTAEFSESRRWWWCWGSLASRHREVQMGNGYKYVCKNKIKMHMAGVRVRHEHQAT